EIVRRTESVGRKHDQSGVYSLFPMHVGMRQYWRDANSLLQWTRSDPHRQWWQSFLKDSGGTGFWHETYFRRGGIEAVYDDVPENIGLMAFAPVVPARGPMFGAATRAEKEFAGELYCRRKSSTGKAGALPAELHAHANSIILNGCNRFPWETTTCPRNRCSYDWA